MGGRTMPLDCLSCGGVLDWGDFGPDSNDGSVGTTCICEPGLATLQDAIPLTFDGWWLDLDPVDRAAFRRFYRILRIAVYANQEHTGPEKSCYQGCYGKSREEAKRMIVAFGREISWHLYLGSK